MTAPLPGIAELAPQLRSIGIDVPADARVGTFGDSPALCQELLALIRSGRKRGGASLVWAHEFEAEPLPRVGDVEVVVDPHGAPCLVTRVTEVEVVPYSQVSAEFAAREGEGDGSLTYWRAAHWAFFSRECERIGRTPHESMPVVCCAFEVLAEVPEDAPVQIEPYNAEWPAKFIAERELLASVLSQWLAGPIEHVGSTAVPGLAAKPVIDIMAAVTDLESSRPALAELEKIGYCHAPYKADVMHWLCKPSPAHRTHHLHLVPFNGARWIECLAFRDLLAANPAVAKEYVALKYRLAAAYRHDRERYTEEKGAFIESALRGKPIL